MWCVLGGVLLSRTLAGAVPSALSGLASGFGMGAGRFPVAVTTETSGLGSVVRWIRLCGCPPTTVTLCVVWLGGGLGVDRIVDASRLAAVFPVTPTYRPCGGRVGGCGGCCLCRPISTSQLEAVAGLPLLAYQPSSLLGAYQNTKGVLWRPYLEDGFPLRCFQRLPFPNVANQPCPGRDNWHTRGSSVPVLSY